MTFQKLLDSHIIAHKQPVHIIHISADGLYTKEIIKPGTILEEMTWRDYSGNLATNVKRVSPSTTDPSVLLIELQPKLQSKAGDRT